MELQVKIYKISATQKVSDSFSKREFIVETQEDYKQYLLLQVVKDKCSILDQYKIGDDVTVSLNLKGRLWQNPQNEEKCFNTLECWRISKITDALPSPQSTSTQTKPIEATPTTEEESDLPF